METHRIRDPVHGFIHYSDDERRVIDSPNFQRLKGIRQLALTFLVYPGAMHTRFEHSLGVMEMATRAFDALVGRQGKELRKNFSRISLGLGEARQLLRLTALFHDTGHLPFSHAAENVLPRGKGHEDVSVAIVKERERFLNRTFYRGVAEHIELLIRKNAIVPPELQILKKLISSQLDVDRADYLLRDSHHCGVEYGNFDYLRLFEMLRLVPGAQGGLELAVDRGGVHPLEALILARYYMFAQVYFHKVRRIYDVYLSQYMQQWCGKKYSTNILNVTMHNDQDVLVSMLKDSKNGGPSRRDLASRILNRKHHRVVFETSDFAEPLDKRDMATLKEELEQRYRNSQFILDLNATGYIHKFYSPEDEVIGEEFKVQTKYGEFSLTRESKVIARLPKRFAVYRIYSEGTTNALERFRSFARERWQQLSQGR